MKTKVLAACALGVILLFSADVQGIDRDADMIDSLGVVMLPFKNGKEAFSVQLWGESLIKDPSEKFAFLFGGQYGEVTPHRTDSLDYWSVSLGVKWYVMPRTSLAVIGEYGQYDESGTPSVRAGTLRLKQRIVPAEHAISPYILASMGLRSADEATIAKKGRLVHLDEASSETRVSLGGGCDFAMTDTMVIVLEGAYAEGDDLEDGWLGSVAMKYYWE